jgi:hypothetical protein
LWRRKSEGGAGIPFPPTPFPSRPARAEKFSALPRKARQSKFAIWIFVKKSSDFVQKVPNKFFASLKILVISILYLVIGARNNSFESEKFIPNYKLHARIASICLILKI